MNAERRFLIPLSAEYPQYVIRPRLNCSPVRQASRLRSGMSWVAVEGFPSKRNREETKMIIWLGLMILSLVAAIGATAIALRNHDKFCWARLLQRDGNC